MLRVAPRVQGVPLLPYLGGQQVQQQEAAMRRQVLPLVWRQNPFGELSWSEAGLASGSSARRVRISDSVPSPLLAIALSAASTQAIAPTAIATSSSLIAIITSGSFGSLRRATDNCF